MKKKGSDPRNKINDLSGKEWVQFTRSWCFQQGLGNGHKETKIEKQHPAPFSYKDIQKFIRFFTKGGMTVLDPFCGVASTIKAAALCGRNAIGIELSSKWVKLGKMRIQQEIPARTRNSLDLQFIKGDCLKKLPNLSPQSVEYIITSPPYWNILNKDPDRKIKSERLGKGLATSYSKSPFDLGNIKDYNKFLKVLKRVFKQCRRVLKKEKYMTIIVSDFRHKSVYYPYHMDVINLAEEVGLSLKGTLVLIQNNKNLYPYGYPFSYVQNIHHQYAVIFQRV